MPNGRAAGHTAIYRLDNPVQNYAWGSTTTIPRMLGVEPTGEPVAELWLGAHPAAPSRLAAADHTGSVGPPPTLPELIGSDPAAMLGTAVHRRFRDLPFLLKVLAVARPLSLQAHPSLAQARLGFAAENEAGIPLDSPQRNFRDANHKPELVCALTDFDGLCGFRPVARTAEFLAALDTPLMDALRVRLIADGGLRDVVTDLLIRSAEGIVRILDEVLPAARRLAEEGGAWSAEAAWIVRLDSEYPGDRGAAIALLLNLVHLSPGEALFLHAGELHAYLHGVAVEVLANSDNVLRGGLTPKHIDVPALLAVLQIREDVIDPLGGEDVVPGHRVYPSDVADFSLARFEVGALDAPILLAEGVPRILLCTSGTARLTAKTGDSLILSTGQSAFVPADAGIAVVAVAEATGRVGAGTVYLATPNLP